MRIPQKQELQHDAVQKAEIVHQITKLSDNICEIIYENKDSIYETSGSMVRFASFITMCGRSRILNVIRNLGIENVYYCDTDSVVFDPSKGMNMGVKIGKEMQNISD